MLSWADVMDLNKQQTFQPVHQSATLEEWLGREMYQTVLGQFSPSIKMVFVWHISAYNKFQVLYLCVWISILCIKVMMTSMLHAVKHNLICL